MKWGNVTITSKATSDDGSLILRGTVDPEDKDFKKTKKITWVSSDPDTTFEVTLVEFDHIITKKKIEEADKVEDLVNRNSRIEYTAIAEGALRTIQQGQSIQLERRGYFYVDQVAWGERKLRLHYIPDGKSKAMSKISHKIDAKELAGGKGKADGANKAEAKKLAAAAGGAPVVTDGAAEDGAPQISKKEAKKQAKKDEKKQKKAQSKQDGAATTDGAKPDGQ